MFCLLLLFSSKGIFGFVKKINKNVVDMCPRTRQPLRRLLVARVVGFGGCNRDFASSFDLSRYPLPL